MANISYVKLADTLNQIDPLTPKFTTSNSSANSSNTNNTASNNAPKSSFGNSLDNVIKKYENKNNASSSRKSTSKRAMSASGALGNIIKEREDRRLKSADITAAKNNLEKEKAEYSKVRKEETKNIFDSGWGAASMAAKGGSTYSKLNPDAESYDWSIPRQSYSNISDAKNEVTAAKKALTAAKDDEWWRIATEDYQDLADLAMNSDPVKYQKALEEAQKEISNNNIQEPEEVAIYAVLQDIDKDKAARFKEINDYLVNERKVTNIELPNAQNRNAAENIATYIGSSFATPISFLDSAWRTIKEAITGEYTPVDLNSDIYAPVRARQQSKESLLSDIENENLQMLAGFGLDIADYATKLPFGPTAGLAIMGSGAVSESTYSALQRGIPVQDALLTGLSSGAIEVLTEKIPFSRLLKLAKSPTKAITKTTAKSATKATAKAATKTVTGRITRAAVRSTLQQSGIEATEELISDYANTLSDIAINGDNSVYGQTVAYYKSKGKSDEEARRQANIDIFIDSPMRSFMGGFVSGGVLGTGANAIGNIRLSNSGRNLRNIGRNASTPEDVVLEVINTGLESADGTVSKQLAEELYNKYANDEKISNKKLGELNQANIDAINQEASLKTEIGNLINILNEQPDNYVFYQDFRLSDSPLQDKAGGFINAYLANNPGVLGSGLRNTGNEIDFDITREIIDTGLQSPIGTRSRSLAEALYNKYISGEQITDGELGELYQANATAIEQENAINDSLNMQNSIGKTNIDDYTNTADTTIPSYLEDYFNARNDYPKILIEKPDFPLSANSLQQLNDGDIVNATYNETVEAASNTYNATSEAVSASLAANREEQEIARLFKTPQGRGRLVENQFANQNIQKAAEANIIDDKIAQALAGGKHKQVSNKQLMEAAEKAINENGTMEVENYITNKINNGGILNPAETVASLMILETYSRAGRVKEATDLASVLDSTASEAGRILQVYKLIQQNLPGGLVIITNNKLRKQGLPELTNQEENTVNALQELASNWGALSKLDVAELNTIVNEYTSKMIPLYAKAVGKIIKNKDWVEVPDWLNLLPMKLADSKRPSTAIDKFRAFQRMNLLLNPKTQIRNITGNILFSGAELASNTLVAPWVDRLIARKTGQRIATLPQVKDYAKGARQGIREVNLAARTGLLNYLGNRYTDDAGAPSVIFGGKRRLSKMANALDMATTYALTFGDKLFSAGREADIAAQLKKVNPSLNDVEAAEIAHRMALETTFQNDSLLSQGLLKLRDVMSLKNTKAKPVAKRVAEIASYSTLPFAKTPANLLSKTIEYSPVGLINGIAKTVKVVRQRENSTAFDQRMAVNAISRGITGSGIMGLGVMLALAGLASGGNSDEDEEFKELNGISDNSIKIKLGDDYYWIDFSSLGPIPAAINTGASIYGELKKVINDEGTIANLLASIFARPIEDALEDDLWSGMVDLVGYLHEGDIIGGIQEIFGDAATQSIPLGSFLRMITGIVDPYTRETSSDNEYGWIWNRIASQIPGLSTTLPIKYDSLGEEVKRYDAADNGFERFLWSALMPGIATKDRSKDETVKTISDIYNATGESSVIPNTAPYDIKYNGETYPLYGKHRSEYQETTGQSVMQWIEDVLNDPVFFWMGDEEKARILSTFNTTASEKAKQSFLDKDEYDVDYQSESSSAKQLDFIDNISSYGVAEGQAIQLYKNVNREKASTRNKVETIIYSGLTPQQQIAAVNYLLDDRSDDFLDACINSINMGIADSWVELYDMSYKRETVIKGGEEKEQYKYDKADLRNRLNEMLINGEITYSEYNWLKTTTRFKTL